MPVAYNQISRSPVRVPPTICRRWPTEPSTDRPGDPHQRHPTRARSGRAHHPPTHRGRHHSQGGQRSAAGQAAARRAATRPDRAPGHPLHGQPTRIVARSEASDEIVRSVASICCCAVSSKITRGTIWRYRWQVHRYDIRTAGAVADLLPDHTIEVAGQMLLVWRRGRRGPQPAPRLREPRLQHRNLDDARSLIQGRRGRGRQQDPRGPTPAGARGRHRARRPSGDPNQGISQMSLRSNTPRILLP